MLALALDLGPPNHLVADDAGLAGTRPEPRDQAFLARHLAALELLPYRYSDAIEVHGPPPPACFLRESRLANAVPTTRSCYPSRVTPTTMRASFYEGPGRFATGSVPVPAPARGEALLRVRRVGICGTDLHIFQGHLDHRVPRGGVIGHETFA